MIVLFQNCGGSFKVEQPQVTTESSTTLQPDSDANSISPGAPTQIAEPTPVTPVDPTPKPPTLIGVGDEESSTSSNSGPGTLAILCPASANEDEVFTCNAVIGGSVSSATVYWYFENSPSNPLCVGSLECSLISSSNGTLKVFAKATDNSSDEQIQSSAATLNVQAALRGTGLVYRDAQLLMEGTQQKRSESLISCLNNMNNNPTRCNWTPAGGSTVETYNSTTGLDPNMVDKIAAGDRQVTVTLNDPYLKFRVEGLTDNTRVGVSDISTTPKTVIVTGLTNTVGYNFQVFAINQTTQTVYRSSISGQIIPKIASSCPYTQLSVVVPAAGSLLPGTCSGYINNSAGGVSGVSGSRPLEQANMTVYAGTQCLSGNNIGTKNSKLFGTSYGICEASCTVIADCSVQGTWVNQRFTK